ncbi:MAG: MBL fold metallo-hydrolase [Oscillospiraceae bacterium]|nr:MBL fold metallo-hydrolase [Oscillospiraceae bacterium]
MFEMKIKWYGHACFEIRTADGSVVIDPYSDQSVPGLPPLCINADTVLCSHEHRDHNCRNAVHLSGKQCNISISSLNTWHDEVKGAVRGSNQIHILNAEGMKLVHFGDLGCELTSEETELLRNADVIMIPIGGHYTIDSVQASEIVAELDPRIVIPMHYRGRTEKGSVFGYEEISTSDAFRKTCFNPTDYAGSLIEVDKNTPKQTAFLQLQ